MKRSLLALAVLGTFAGTAAAQSSVTLFGVVDVNARYVKNDRSDGGDDNRKSLSQDGINSSRLGFRGVEDLGGGLKAGFWLEGAVNPDTGTPGGLTFRRRSTLSLIGNWGELRLGRDYTPVFWNQTVFDPFGTNGVGSLTNVGHIFSTTPSLGTTFTSLVPTAVRVDNSVAYFLPASLGGLYGWLTVAPPEGSTAETGRYVGGRIGYAAGPFDVVFAASQQYVDPGKFKQWNIAGSWDFGIAKLMGQINEDKFTSDVFGQEVSERRYLLGAVVPLGSGEVHASWVRNDVRKPSALSDDDADQLAIGYVYNLSKRTAVYGTASRINNKGNSDFNETGAATGTSTAGGPTPGKDSTGFEVGIRHFF
jgi:predicted porin